MTRFNVIQQVEVKLDANGNSDSDYKKAEEECPKGYVVLWNRWEKGFKYRKLGEDGYIVENDYNI
tara:strand:+ start:1007 stop:1201 length:195 start_codon:yes stop_codon:yes gene_type:complete